MITAVSTLRKTRTSVPVLPDNADRNKNPQTSARKSAQDKDHQSQGFDGRRWGQGNVFLSVSFSCLSRSRCLIVPEKLLSWSLPHGDPVAGHKQTVGGASAVLDAVRAVT